MPVKIKFIKDCDEGSVGQIENYSKKSAQNLVENGFAEYYEEKSQKTTKKSGKRKTTTKKSSKKQKSKEPVKIKLLKDCDAGKAGEIKEVGKDIGEIGAKIFVDEDYAEYCDKDSERSVKNGFAEYYEEKPQKTTKKERKPKYKISESQKEGLNHQIDEDNPRILDFFMDDEDIQQKSDGTFKTKCPSCGLQGGRTRGFILFPDGDRAYCHESGKTHNILETYALKSGLISCAEGRSSGEKGSVLKGHAFKQTLDSIRQIYGYSYHKTLSEKLGLKEDIALPNGDDNVLISDFAQKVVNKLRNEYIIFWRPGVGAVEIDKDTDKANFKQMKSSRFVTLIENYFRPRITRMLKGGEKVYNYRSCPKDIANIVLESHIFQNNLPKIERIFNVQKPILYNGDLTYPKIGYDSRFNSYTPKDAPRIKYPQMDIKAARKLLYELHKDFCFESKEDYDGAISALLTPFVRGLFSNFNVRTPFYVYSANRERSGKDYLAGLRSILFEGQAIEDPPISVGGRVNDEEIRKYITTQLFYGRGMMHFSNNKGYLNSAVLEASLTKTSLSDRQLGSNELIQIDNEVDYSMSANMGLTMTPDLLNRSKFVKLFLEIEDANNRNFSDPNLHLTLYKNRETYLSALYALVRNWFDNNMPAGSKPFASFPEWAKVVGGIMESAGYENPCKSALEEQSVTSDNETEEMKIMFETMHSKKGEIYIGMKDIKEAIKNSDENIFSYFDFTNRSDLMKFGKKVNMYVGRIMSNIKLQVDDPKKRSDKRKFMFTKKAKPKTQAEVFGNEADFDGENGDFGDSGDFTYPNELSPRGTLNRAQKVPAVPKVPTGCCKPFQINWHIRQQIIDDKITWHPGPHFLHLLSKDEERELDYDKHPLCLTKKPKHTAEDVMNFIKKRGKTHFKTLYNKLGDGSIGYKSDLVRKGKLKQKDGYIWIAN